MEIEWIHLLLKGEKHQSKDVLTTDDEYLDTLRSEKLKTITVPVLKFEYKNLQELANSLQEPIDQLPIPNVTTVDYGLIVTSTRVVEALHKALELIEPSKKDAVLRRFNPELIFVVGERSAKEFQNRIGCNCNIESSQSGNALALTDYISRYCTVHKKTASIRLLYPKGSRSDGTIDSFFTEHNDLKINLDSITVYDTYTVDNLEDEVLEKFHKEIAPNQNAKRVIINVILFSPSGVEALLRSNTNKLVDELKRIYLNDVEIRFKHSSIGKTTESALIRNKLEVFCVATKPNPPSLLKSILKEIVKLS